MTLPTQSPETGLREALELFQSFGCPLCNGDCGSANPPVAVCPMQVAAKALAERPAVEREAVEQADVFQAIHDACADEYNGAPCGDIIIKGCEAAGYIDPESAADSFKAEIAAKVLALLLARPEPVVDHIGGLMDPLFAPEPVVDGAAEVQATFALGDRVEKTKGSSWRGRVVGTYSTWLTPEGYAVESEHEPGSVQIYPASVLRALPDHVGGVETGASLPTEAR